MQIMSFVYTLISDFSIITFTSARFLESLHHIMTVKINLHYSQITDKINGSQ